MKPNIAFLILIAAASFIAGCQTATLKPQAGEIADGSVIHPLFLGETRITVVLDGKTYVGGAGEMSDEVPIDQQLRFGWKPGHRHPFIKQEMKFHFGTSTLIAEDGQKLVCDHLKHGDDWRLRCKTAEGKEIALYRVKH